MGDRDRDAQHRVSWNHEPIADCRLYGILDTGYVNADRMISMTRSLIAGGIDVLQLRAKKESPDSILGMSREIAPICRAAGIPFILNDQPRNLSARPELMAPTSARMISPWRRLAIWLVRKPSLESRPIR